ncbi:MAG: hypothetical protein EA343_24130 [Nodularia sp. (in: Bacteria)]|nr:MAG: hypothetical protein EA343_24130 [Nodularia sp. (in: cyanobacteria)]
MKKGAKIIINVFLYFTMLSDTVVTKSLNRVMVTLIIFLKDLTFLTWGIFEHIKNICLKLWQHRREIKNYFWARLFIFPPSTP